MRAALGTTTARTTTSRSVTFCHGGIAAPARAPPSPLFAGRLASAAAAAPLASRFACSAAPAPPSASPPAAEGGVEPPSSAVTARTIVDLVAHGTLCTVGEDGAPLGTYASYVLDPTGQPLLRLRSDAVHTANLGRSPRCSLFVQAPDKPARLLARCTLLGSASRLDPAASEEAAAAHVELHGGSGAGVDAPRPDDVYFKLAVASVFHVAGLGGSAAAEAISGEVYQAAKPDPLRSGASALVAEFNTSRPDEVARIAALAAGCSLDDLAAAELLWVDEGGAFAWLARAGGAGGADGGEVVRVRFARRVIDDRDARSSLTMLSQLAWELERGYVPVMPAVPDPVAS